MTICITSMYVELLHYCLCLMRLTDYKNKPPSASNTILVQSA